MIRRQWFVRAGGCLAGLTLFLGWATACLGAAKPAKTRASPPGAELFAATNVWAFEIEMDEAAEKALLAKPREWARATLRLGNEVFDDVEIHIKGSQGSLQPINGPCPSLTVSFNRFVSTRRFHGLRKIHFNNTAEDPSFMTEILCGDLCRRAGLPAARAGYATLTLKVRRQGAVEPRTRAPRLYVLKEGLTKEFLAQYFTQTGGVLYDGGFRKDINQELEVIGGEAPPHQADRTNLVAAAREPDPARRWARLQKALDTDRFITYLAMTTLMWNWDSYPTFQNNYRIYHDPATDKLVFIPHGMDQMFWQPQGPIYPRMIGLLAVSVMGVPEARKLYRERLATLQTNVFKVDELTARIDQLANLIRPVSPRPDTDAQAVRLKRNIAGRAQSIAQQLQMPDPFQPADPFSVTFKDGVAWLGGWARSSADKAATLAETRTPAGQRALRIQHENPATSSWVKRVTLPGGSYELVGRAKALRLEPQTFDREAGAGLRVLALARAASPRLPAGADWQELRCRFVARSPAETIELSCELRNARGEAWFDLDSLRLQRVTSR